MKITKSQRNQRRFNKEQKKDQRTTGQRDRDRIIHSSAFRRLAGVTQVVDPAEGRVFHNRLTHTLKVAQIGRRLAEKFVKENKTSDLSKIGGLDPEVVESAALIHDLGHPPFGHLAEKVLDELVCEKGATQEGYEGNAQSFRIVTQLEIRDPAVPGLNLSRATLNAVLKYPWYRQQNDKKHRKWGAYRVDEEYFQWVREPFGKSHHRTLEAEIMDWADDIAFSVHDLEDFYCAGLIPLDILVNQKIARDKCLKRIFKRWADDPREKEPDKQQFAKAFHGLLELLPIDAPYDGTMRQRGNLNRASSLMIDRYVQGTKIDLSPSSIGQHLLIPLNFYLEVKALKQLIWLYVIDSPALATQQYGKSKIIEELFEIIFADAMNLKDQKWKFILPEYYQAKLEEVKNTSHGTAQNEQRARLAADFISSMTDQEAIVFHQRVTGTNSGSLLGMRLT